MTIGQSLLGPASHHSPLIRLQFWGQLGEHGDTNRGMLAGICPTMMLWGPGIAIFLRKSFQHGDVEDQHVVFPGNLPQHATSRFQVVILLGG